MRFHEEIETRIYASARILFELTLVKNYLYYIFKSLNCRAIKWKR
jgi:hypothetical protein